MSTNPKDLNPKESSETTISKSKKNVDRSIRTLMQEMEHENTLVQESPIGRLQRVLKIYRGIKPLLTVLASLPLIPSTWRAAIVMRSKRSTFPPQPSRRGRISEARHDNPQSRA